MLALGCGGIPNHAATLDLETATILDLQEAYDHGVTSEEIVQVYLKRMDAYDQSGPALNAIRHLNANALERARSLDEERRDRGPRSLLHGVPILIKDNIDTRDMPTTGGARALAGSLPPADAFVIRRLRDRGAIILAKTNLDEFARGATGTSSLGGQTLNPYNFKKIPGGSSSGSAVGVAALFGWAALGTETGSSVRNPSTKNNLVGFCPTEGLVSRRGVIPQSLVFDRVGTLARNVTDAAIVMGVIAGPDPGDLTTLDGLGRFPPDNYKSHFRKDGLMGARVGVLRQLFGHQEDDRRATDLINSAIEEIKNLGATVIDPLNTDIDLWQRVRSVSSSGGGSGKAGLEYYFSTRGRNFPIKTLQDLLASGGILGRLEDKYRRDIQEPDFRTNPAYRTSITDRLALREYIVALMDQHTLDALIYPHETKTARTLAMEVPDGGKSPGPKDDRGPGKGNTISSASGLPTIVVPVGFNLDGVGVGLEFLGRPFAEGTIIQLAYAYEQASPHRKLPHSTPPIGTEKIEY